MVLEDFQRFWILEKSRSANFSMKVRTRISEPHMLEMLEDVPAE
ncbi:MAG: hypothetical protein R3B55_02770 [Candidatus Paceibacterota bacterium]